MGEDARFVVFRLDEQRYALPLGAVERIVHAVEVTALPDGPAIVLGVIDMAGRVLPVLDLRGRFGLPQRAIGPADQLLIAQAGPRTVALVVDEAQGVIECPGSEIVGSAQIVPGLAQIQGVVMLPDGLVLIQDVEQFLSLDEAHVLDEALRQDVAHAT
jgi:purine-binding chemotaxis protein CheW